MPLLELAEKGFKFGLQISGVSLEIIHEYRPELIEKIAFLIKEKQIDFIGNGYAQIIQPLFPHGLNLQNQILGQKTYKDIIDYSPDICTVNEMALSVGSCESICEAGYSSILMECNNAMSAAKTSSFNQFNSSKIYIDEKEVNVLWCDTVAFQKFQKYVHGEIDLDSYFDWLDTYTHGNEGALCLYCSDAEIFGYRPKRYGTEITPMLDEWERIEHLMKRLKELTILPSSVAKPSGLPINLTNAENPIIVKKQQKYNINRWGITGRNDQNLNTFCYRLFDYAKGLGNSFSDNDWKNLLKLSSSDLRTHIEDNRWKNAEKIKKDFEDRFDNFFSKPDTSLFSQSGDRPVKVDRKRGNNIVSWPNNNPLFGRFELGIFPQTKLMADFYSGYAVVEKLGHRKISDLDYDSSSINNETFNQFSNSSGYEIKKLISSKSNHTLDIDVSVLVPMRTREQIKPCNFSFTSQNWDIDSLFYSTHLGGTFLEKFKFGKESFDQDNILNLNVVGTNGFCPTNGIFIIGDKDKEISFHIDPSKCFSLIRLSYDVVEKKKFLLQLSFVVQDIDETFRENDYAQSFNFKCSIKHT